MKILLFHNPTAGPQPVSRDELTGALEKQGHAVTYRDTDEDGWERIDPAAFDLIAAAGGDGTLRDVFRLLAGGPQRPVLVLATGTANNIARSLGVADRRRVVESLARLEPQPFWFCRVGGGSGELFFESFGTGLFARLLEMHSRDEDRMEAMGGKNAALATLAAEVPAVSLRATGGSHAVDERVLWMEVLNIRSCGPLIDFGKNLPSGPADRLLMVTVPEARRDALVRYFQERDKGGEPEFPDVTVHEFGHEIEVTWDGGTPHVDDELLREATGGGLQSVRIERVPEPLMILR